MVKGRDLERGKGVKGWDLGRGKGVDPIRGRRVRGRGLGMDKEAGAGLKGRGLGMGNGEGLGQQVRRGLRCVCLCENGTKRANRWEVKGKEGNAEKSR